MRLIRKGGAVGGLIVAVVAIGLGLFALSPVTYEETVSGSTTISKSTARWRYWANSLGLPVSLMVTSS